MTSEEPLPDRCGAQCRDGGYCTQYPVAGRDRCRMHGGTQPTGMDSPNAVHGLRSDYLSEEDREIYAAVREHDNAALIQEEIWMVKTKLLRAAREAGGQEGTDLVRELVEQVTADQTVDEDLVDALATLLQTTDGAVDRALGRLTDLVKTHHKIAEGDTVTVEHSGQVAHEHSHDLTERQRGHLDVITGAADRVADAVEAGEETSSPE